MHRFTRGLTICAALLLWLLCSCESQAKEDPDGETKGRLKSIAAQWQGESVEGILSNFPPGRDEKVHMDLGEGPMNLSREQARGVLQRYFGRIDVESCTVRSWRGESGAACEYRYQDGGRSEAHTLLIDLRRVGGSWCLSSAVVN